MDIKEVKDRLVAYLTGVELGTLTMNELNIYTDTVCKLVSLEKRDIMEELLINMAAGFNTLAPSSETKADVALTLGEVCANG